MTHEALTAEDRQKILDRPAMEDWKIDDAREFIKLGRERNPSVMMEMVYTQLEILADEIVRLRENIKSATLMPDQVLGAGAGFASLHKSAKQDGEDFMVAFAKRGHDFCREITRLHAVHVLSEDQEAVNSETQPPAGFDAEAVKQDQGFGLR